MRERSIQRVPPMFIPHDDNYALCACNQRSIMQNLRIGTLDAARMYSICAQGFEINIFFRFRQKDSEKTFFVRMRIIFFPFCRKRRETAAFDGEMVRSPGDTALISTMYFALGPAPFTHRNYEEQYAALRVCQSSSLNSSCEHDVCTACDPGAVLT